MFIIFGTETKRKVLGSSKEKSQCPRCHNEVFNDIQEQTGYFTLFWIPVFPYSEEHYELCPICGHVMRKMDKREAKEMLK